MYPSSFHIYRLSDSPGTVVAVLSDLSAGDKHSATKIGGVVYTKMHS